MIDGRLRPRAQKDVRNIVAYYEREAGAQIAIDFIESLESVIGFLDRNPDSGSLRWQHLSGAEGLRSWPLKGFPHLVFYVARKDRIMILRVLHTSRDIPASLRD